MNLKNILISSVIVTSTLGFLCGSKPALAETVKFDEPQINGLNVDWCVESNKFGWCSNQAHYYAATKFCEYQGFTKSIGWNHTELNGRTIRTTAYSELEPDYPIWKTVEKGGGYFVSITCKKEDIAPLLDLSF